MNNRGIISNPDIFPTNIFQGVIAVPSTSHNQLPAIPLATPLARINLPKEFIMRFLATFFDPDPDQSVPFELVWRTWNWYVQTSYQTRMVFPAGLPKSEMVLGRLLKNVPEISSAMRARTLMRGDLEKGQNHRNYVIVKGIAKKRRLSDWAGQKEPWFPLPWVKGGSNYGAAMQTPDPRHQIYQKLLDAKKQDILNGMKTHIAAAKMEQNLEAAIAKLHKQRDIFILTDVFNLAQENHTLIQPPK